MSDLNLQSALHRLVSAAQLGQQRGVWTPQESIFLNEAITFFVKTPIMVVPPQLQSQMAGQQQKVLEVPLGSESVQM